MLLPECLPLLLQMTSRLGAVTVLRAAHAVLALCVDNFRLKTQCVRDDNLRE